MKNRIIGLVSAGAALAGLLLTGVSAGGEDTIGLPAPAELRQLYSGTPAEWPRPLLHDGAVFEEFGPITPVARPEGRDAQIVALGERLFNEPRLSGSGQFACASCHARELGFTDGLRTAFGHDRQRGNRNSMSLHTAAFMRDLFWDGRAGSLEEQALAAITNPIEMAANAAEIVKRINSDTEYLASFRELYRVDRAGMHEIVSAIAAFERTLRPPRSKWDRMLAGGVDVFTDQELQGLHLFRTKAGCAGCHNGPLFSDQRFHNIGLTYYGRRYEDLGRYAVTVQGEDVGRFRTPSLRGVKRTAPYMHNGLFPSLEGIVNLYNAGGVHEKRTASINDPAAPPPKLDPLVKPLNITPEERSALVSFLETL